MQIFITFILNFDTKDKNITSEHVLTQTVANNFLNNSLHELDMKTKYYGISTKNQKAHRIRKL